MFDPEIKAAEFGNIVAPGIIWDHYGIQNPHTGIGRHALCLREEITKLGYSPDILRAGYRFIKPLALRYSGFSLRKYIDRLESNRPVVVHGLSNFNLPRKPQSDLRKVKSVITVHDLIPELLPGTVSLALRTFLSYQMPRTLVRADAIISVSQWTKDHLEDRYPATRGRVVLIPNGMPDLQEASFHSGWSPSPRFLTVARGEDYKRIRLIPEIMRHCPSDWVWDLVTDDRGSSQLLNETLQMSDRRLRIHKGLSDADLQRLFHQAWAYVHPSLMEGYCMPAAQALATGRPVVFTKGSGIDEVVGSAGIGLNAQAQAIEWVESLGEIVAQHIYYRLLSREQAQRAPKWYDVATRTLEVYGIL